VAGGWAAGELAGQPAAGAQQSHAARGRAHAKGAGGVRHAQPLALDEQHQLALGGGQLPQRPLRRRVEPLGVDAALDLRLLVLAQHQRPAEAAQRLRRTAALAAQVGQAVDGDAEQPGTGAAAAAVVAARGAQRLEEHDRDELGHLVCRAAAARGEARHGLHVAPVELLEHGGVAGVGEQVGVACERRHHPCLPPTPAKRYMHADEATAGRRR
jgi:hypothetical protein